MRFAKGCRHAFKQKRVLYELLKRRWKKILTVEKVLRDRSMKPCIGRIERNSSGYAKEIDRNNAAEPPRITVHFVFEINLIEC